MKKTEDKIAAAFAELMIDKIKQLEVDWQKPWVNIGYTGMPRNLNNRHYNGINSLMLMLLREKEGYRTPVFLTFKQAKENGWDIKKGQKGFPVEFWHQVYKDEHGRRMSFEEFKQLSEDEQQKCKSWPISKVYIVFNIEQTRMPELEPEKWQKLLDTYSTGTLKDEEGMMRCPELDFMIDKQTWVCPVKVQQSNSAFYSPGTDSITVPLKGQFVDGEKFYGTLLHEMAHSTGHPDRLDRNMNNKFGDAKYGREELVAEMSSAMMASQLGICKGIEEENVAYLKSWLKTIGEDPEFIRTVMSDVNKACNLIQEKVMNQEMAEEMKNEAIASIDKFLEERKAEEQQHKVPVMTQQEVLNMTPSLHPKDEEQLPFLLDSILAAYEDVKQKSHMAQAWVRLGDDYHVIGDDAIKLAKDLKLSTHKVQTPDGRPMDELSFHMSKLSSYMPQAVRLGNRVIIADAMVEEQQVAKEIEMDTKLHMAHLGNGITIWEDGDNEYTAHISPDRKVTLHKEFSPESLERINHMAESGNMIVGNEGAEHLALNPINPATRFVPKPYGADSVPLSQEKVGSRMVVCSGRNILQFNGEAKKFEDYPLIERPEAYIVSVTGLDKVRDSLVYMQKMGIDTTRLHSQYFFETLDQAETELSSVQKEFKRICFEVRNQGSAEKPEMAVVAFHNAPEELDKQGLLPRFYMKDNAMLYNRPAQSEIDKGLPMTRQILSQNNYVRVNGRDWLRHDMNALKHYGVSFTKELEEAIYQAFEQGQVMPRAVAARDKIYLHVKNGVAESIDFNLSEYTIDEEPLLEFQGSTLRHAALYDRELDSAYLVVGYGVDNTFDSFVKVPAGPDALQKAQKYLQNTIDLPVLPEVMTACIIEVDSNLKDTVQYRMAGKEELARMIQANEQGGFKEICRLPVVEKVMENEKKEEDNITNHINDSTMAKKSTTEQVPAQEVKDQVNEQVNEKQEAQQTAGEEQQAEKKLREGASIFQRKDKAGNLIPGVYGINVVKDGVRSETATISKEDRDQYFKDVKGKTGEEAEAVRMALAEKYITPEGKRIEAPKPEAKEGEEQKADKGKGEYFNLHHAAPEKAARITDPRVFKKDGEQQYRIRCKIDGEQQLSRTISDAKTTAFFNGYKGMPAEEQLQRRTDLAAVVFADVLRGEKQEQSRGMSR